MCAPQFTASVEAYAQGMSFDAHQMLRNRLEAQRLPQAAEAVMQVRASRPRPIPSHSGTNRTSQAPPAGSLQEAATAAHQRGDYANALNMFRSLAEQGDATAQNMLGLMYDDGKGVAQNYAEAVRWFRKAAEQGEPGAEFMVGLRYAEGRGLMQDYAEAARWLRLAVAQGEPHAQKVLDDVYSRCPALRDAKNLISPTARATAGSIKDAYAANRRCDYFTGLRIVRPLAEHGDAKAQLVLGVAYEDGRGLPQNYGEAAKWYRKAADKGDAGAQYFLGGMYMKGRGVPQDYTEAAKWYRKAARQGNASAKDDLNALYDRFPALRE